MSRPGSLLGVLIVIVAAASACRSGGAHASRGATTSTSGAVALEAGSGRGTPAANPLVVPLRVETVGESTRVIAQIRVGHGPVVPVLLDTGSAGLRVLPGVVGPDANPTGQTSTSTFGSGTGVRVTGRITDAPVTIAATTTAPIAVSVMEKACTPGGGCEPASALTGLLSGTRGILGIALSNGTSPAAPIFSPLLQLPPPYSSGYTLQLGTGAIGTLTLGRVRPTGAALPLQPATPPHLPNGAPAYQKDVQLCWTVAGAHACGNTDFDIGAPNAIVTPTALPGLPSSGGVLPAGTAARLTTPDGAAVWSFTATGPRSPTTIRYAALPGGYTSFNTGIGFALTHTLAFDLAGATLYVTSD